MPFKFHTLEIPDVVRVEPTVFGDERGFFMETFKRPDFNAAGVDFSPVQENHSKSAKGVLRGLHYQVDPFAQGKLVRVVRGRIFDVAVDMRKSSKTFSKWVGAELSEQNRQMLLVPRGFAHGFVSLEDGTEVVYLVDNDYSKENEAGLIWNDPQVGIEWPLKNPLLSEKDSKWPVLKGAKTLR
jgi:dTDP-4-dehydrorhamnose 3,5-epimerase